MPTLRKRSDGCYFVHHYYQQFSTWQIQGEGVRVLKQRNINEDQYFSTDLFMELWRRGLVYHGDAIPTSPRHTSSDSIEVAWLRERVTAFYRYIFDEDLEAAWMLTTKEDASMQDLFFLEVAQFGPLTSWRLEDLQVYDVTPHSQSTLAVSQLGITHVRLSRSNAVPTYLKQYGVNCEGQWLIAWAGFDAAA